ncbi:MAG: restriction endonuclease [Hyphomicrobiales bacterium]
MPIPEYRRLMVPILELALSAGGDIGEAELADELAMRIELTPIDLAEMLPSGRETVYRERLRWALSYLVQTGQVEIGAGLVRMTAAGRATLMKAAGNTSAPFSLQGPPQRSPLAANSFAEPPPPSYAGPPGDAPEGARQSLDDHIARLLEAHEAARQHLRNEVLSRLMVQTPAFFEGVVADLLVALGYGRQRDDLLEQLTRRGDGGVDGSIEADELGLDVIYIQAKRYKTGVPVQIADVRDFAGSLEANRASKGVFVTTSRFPASAHEFVKAYPRRIRLIDGVQLVDLMIRTNLGVTVRETLEIKALDETYFRGRPGPDNP